MCAWGLVAVPCPSLQSIPDLVVLKSLRSVLDIVVESPSLLVAVVSSPSLWRERGRGGGERICGELPFSLLILGKGGERGIHGPLSLPYPRRRWVVFERADWIAQR